jgi:uncharacterized membrane protein
MNRYELDALIAHYKLDAAAANEALEASHARPTRAELIRFAVRLLQLAGVLSLAAGIVFFIAANWDDFEVLGRFVLVEALLVVAVAIALWKPPPAAAGKYALLMAFILTGVLLALFGQTYQTGADVYELFLTWALLGLVFAIAAQWSVTWGAWVLVLNVALWLYCGWRPETGWFWIVFAGWDIDLAVLVLGPMIVNLALFAVVESLQRTRYEHIAPAWLGRVVLTYAIGFATWAGIVAIFGSELDSRSSGDALALLILLGALGSIAAYAVRQRADVFPLALIAGSLIVLTTSALGDALGASDMGAFFVLALWLIASSTVSGRLLMKLVRTWQPEANA